jgi:hypothetical protein
VIEYLQMDCITRGNSVQTIDLRIPYRHKGYRPSEPLPPPDPLSIPRNDSFTAFRAPEDLCRTGRPVGAKASEFERTGDVYTPSFHDDNPSRQPFRRSIRLINDGNVGGDSVAQFEIELTDGDSGVVSLTDPSSVALTEFKFVGTFDGLLGAHDVFNSSLTHSANLGKRATCRLEPACAVLIVHCMISVFGPCLDGPTKCTSPDE